MPNVLLISSAGETSRVADQVTLLARRRAGNIQTFTLHANAFACGLRDMPLVRKAAAHSDIVHAFGTAALTMAVLVRARAIVYTPTRWPSRAAIAWLRAAMAYRPIHVVCESDTLRRAYVTRGVPGDRCTTVRPGVSMGGLSIERDESLRLQLGLSSEDHVVFAPLPMGKGGDHHLAVWAVSLVNVLDSRCRLLVPVDIDDVLKRVRSRLMDAHLLVIAAEHVKDVSARSLYGAADLVLLTPTPHARSTDIVTAMASQRPIVSTVTPQVCEFIEDRHTALLARQASPRMVGRRIMDAFEDPALMRAVADRARVEVYEHFTISKMREALDGVYAKSYSTTVPARSNPARV